MRSTCLYHLPSYLMARVRHSDMGYHCNDGVPSLAKRTIDGSDYGVLILASIFFWTDLFVAASGCSASACARQMCLSTTHRWLWRIGAPLYAPVARNRRGSLRRSTSQLMSPTVPEFHQPLIERRCWLSDPYRSKVASHLSEQDNSY
jgi:hypothetical protein